MSGWSLGLGDQGRGGEGPSAGLCPRTVASTPGRLCSESGLAPAAAAGRVEGPLPGMGGMVTDLGGQPVLAGRWGQGPRGSGEGLGCGTGPQLCSPCCSWLLCQLLSLLSSDKTGIMDIIKYAWGPGGQRAAGWAGLLFQASFSTGSCTPGAWPQDPHQAACGQGACHRTQVR